MNSRKAEKLRETKETKIKIKLELEGQNFKFENKFKIKTDSAFFTHMLEQFARHSGFCLEIEAQGDTEIDDHHLVEDTGITLGQVFREALGNRIGVKRFGSARVPMDETLVVSDIDLTSRAFLYYDLKPGREFIGQFDTSLVLEFWRAFVNNFGLNLHISQIRGKNAHHIVEASFKSVALALKEATYLDQDLFKEKKVLSTKGTL